MNFTAELPDISLLTQESIYMIGIKGVGMTALATMLVEAGLHVGGADVSEKFVTDELLHSMGIVVDDLAEAQIPADCRLVIYSGAHQGRQNPLVRRAVDQNIVAVNLATAVGLLSREVKTIGVCGVGGKSTTSALLSWIFDQSTVSASYAVGVGNIPNLGRSGHWATDAEYFVVEADEYVADPLQDKTPRFLYLQPHILICTSLTFDHPDVYESFADTERAFRTLFEKLPTDGLLVYNGDDPALRSLVEHTSVACRTVAVGGNEENDIVLSDWQVEDGYGSVSVNEYTITSQVPGQHNLRNAVYAAVVAEEIGVDWAVTERAIREFRSTQRRFEYRGKTQSGAMCYDDYAHHPHEILAIAQTLQAWFPEKRKTIAFQPHTYSRTQALHAEFAQVLAGSADQVYLMPIFASAREQFDNSITSEILVSDVQSRGQSAELVVNQTRMLELINQLGPDDIFITLGAGDIYKVYEHVDFYHTTE